MQEPGRGHELGSGGRSLGHGGDSSIGAWVWHGTGRVQYSGRVQENGRVKEPGMGRGLGVGGYFDRGMGCSL